MHTCTHCVHKRVVFSHVDFKNSNKSKILSVSKDSGDFKEQLKGNVFGDMYVECKKGNQKEMVDFYENNALLSTKDIDAQLPCFEEDVSLKPLDKTLKQTLRLLKDVEKA